MIHIGDYNKLTILRDTEPGLFLGDNEDQEVLLPNRYVPDTFEIDDQIDVFVYLDNEERLVAVTDHPYIKKGEFALLNDALYPLKVSNGSTGPATLCSNTFQKF